MQQSEWIMLKLELKDAAAVIFRRHRTWPIRPVQCYQVDQITFRALGRCTSGYISYMYLHIEL